MADLLELAGLCEQATGPDHELDLAIVYALHPDIGPYRPLCEGDDPIFWHDPYRKMSCPNFTSSIDAAMTLVPEGWWLESMSDGISKSQGKLTLLGCAATLSDGETEAYSDAATRPLTVAAACLRACAAAHPSVDIKGAM
jgi:hypothetical protein